MKEIIASPNRVLHLGYEGEDNVTLIKFPYDDTWLDCGDGEFKIRVLRHGDTQAYNATEVIDDRESMILTMTVTDIELSVRGRGEMQLVYICPNAVEKSEIFRFNVNRAIDSEVVDPPDGSIIASVEESLEEIKDEIGSLNNLTTTDKNSLVSAINEVNAKEGGSSVTVDDELSGISENPVQNKVVKARFDGLDQTVAGIGGRLATAETALEGKTNTADVNSALALKANTADMNTALALKANSADVQTALAGKASADIATQSGNGLMSSADKTKLDGLDNGIIGANDEFELIRCITLEEDMAKVTIDADNSSSSFEITDFIVFIWSVGASGATSEASVKVALNSTSLDTNRCSEIASLIRKEGDNTSRSGYVFGINAKKLCYFAFSSATIIGQIVDGSGNISEFGEANGASKTQGFTGVSTVNTVTVGTTSGGKLGTGSIIALYGVRE